MKGIPITLLVFLAFLSLSAWSFRDDWDGEFKTVTETYLPLGTDWRMLKSLCIQESKLNPLAVSPVGAFGLCQFMPTTSREVGRKLGVSPDAFWLPEVSIRAAGYYLGALHKSWKAQRPPMDRFKLSAASYNAGIGNLLKAQRICDGGVLYDQVIPCLPRVTGKHSKETIDYVQNIVYRWYPMLLLE